MQKKPNTLGPLSFVSSANLLTGKRIKLGKENEKIKRKKKNSFWIHHGKLTVSAGFFVAAFTVDQARR